MHPGEPIRPSFRCGPYIVDGHACQVQLDGKFVQLSDTEFEALYQLVENRGNIVPRTEFRLWKTSGPDAAEYRRPVDMCVVELRSKLDHSMIVTVRGKGYRISPRFVVEIIATPSATELQRTMDIALAQVKEHSSRGLQAAIRNCNDLLSTGRVADAYATLALAYINLGHVGFCRELPTVSSAKAREVIGNALRWYPQFSSAFALRGVASLIYDYDWRAAENDFNEALTLNPKNELAHCFLSHLLVAKESFEPGLEHAHIAAELDYDSRMTVITEPWLMMFANRVGEAVTVGERVVKRFQDFAIGHIIMGHIYRAAGATAKALEHYELSLEIEFFPDALASIGFIYGQLGKRQDALKCLDRLHQAKETEPLAYLSSYFDAVVHAGLGHTEKALTSLEKSLEQKCDWLIYLDVEPRWAAIRRERRFRALSRSVGLRASTKH